MMFLVLEMPVFGVFSAQRAIVCSHGRQPNGVRLRRPRRCRGWPHDVRPTGRNVGCCLPRFGCDGIGPITDRGNRGRTTPAADGVRTAPTCDWQQCGDLWRRGRLPAELRIGRRRGAATRRAQARRTCPKDRHCLPSECLNLTPLGVSPWKTAAPPQSPAGGDGSIRRRPPKKAARRRGGGRRRGREELSRSNQ
jgi:hypothetical protein